MISKTQDRVIEKIEKVEKDIKKQLVEKFEKSMSDSTNKSQK